MTIKISKCTFLGFLCAIALIFRDCCKYASKMSLLPFFVLELLVLHPLEQFPFCNYIKPYFLIFHSGTDIKLWHGKSGKELGTVDTNQLKNHMATLSPNGRFLAAAAFTADVKVCLSVFPVYFCK